jgi:hypothetical protein
LYHDQEIFTGQPEAIKKTRQWWRVSGRFSAYAHDRQKKNTPERPKQNTNPKPAKHMKTKQSVINSNIRLTVMAAIGLLSTLVPVIQTAHAQDLRPFSFDLVPASDAIANCTSMPNPAATVAVFPREDNRGVDTLDLHAEGLRPNTTFAVFLTERPVPPFGAVQYIGDFTTNAAGRGHVRVDAIIDEAFAFNNITGVRTELNHVVFWFADPNDDEQCVPGSAPGHFDGDNSSGVAAMSSKNFLPGAPLP